MLNKKLAMIALIALLAESVSSLLGPLHASCKIKWKWPSTQCSDVQGDIVTQISNWNNTNCGTGQKCRYALISKTDAQVTAKHVTPVKHYVDDLTFDFTASGGGSGCEVSGYSTSETWYAILDYGTNYCNLHNLIIGATLDKKAGYAEDTSDSVCTQYSSRNCDKY